MEERRATLEKRQQESEEEAGAEEKRRAELGKKDIQKREKYYQRLKELKKERAVATTNSNPTKR